jgi:ABC-type multidrug transport system ATPase subunit
LILVRNLVKRFRKASGQVTVAVDDLSFQVAAGEVYGLLGPNGAGKTTTLRMLATLTQPDAGQWSLDGVDARGDPVGIRQRLAYVPAEGGLPARLSPREVVRLFAGIQGVPRPEEVAERVLEKMGARGYAHLPCGDLSTGMKRRVVLARALVHEPKALLLDEPTDGLDVPGRRDVLQLVRDQARAGRAVVLSSHIMSEVERVVDRVGVVARGKLVAEGTVQQVLALAGANDLDTAFMNLVGESEKEA